MIPVYKKRGAVRQLIGHCSKPVMVVRTNIHPLPMCHSHPNRNHR